MALTFEQIDNLKEGDTLLLAVTLVRKIGHCTFKVKTSKDSCEVVSSMLLSLPPAAAECKRLNEEWQTSVCRSEDGKEVLR